MLKDLTLIHKVGLIGYGQEGQSTHAWLIRSHPHLEIFIFDDKNEMQESVIALNKWLEFNCDLYFKSPGVPWSTEMEMNQNILSSQTELFFSLTKAKVIAITGTTGKSTSSYFLYSLLKSVKENVFLGGNIGLPLIDSIDELNENSYMVAELSSYQLMNITISPKISILLNLYQDHLDYHKTIKNYKDAKMNIIGPGTEVILAGVDVIQQIIKLPGKKYFSVGFGGRGDYEIIEDSFCLNQKPLFSVAAFHQKDKASLVNLTFALSVLHQMGILSKLKQSILSDLKPLTCRLKLAGLFHGKYWYEDGASVIPENTINAVMSLPELDGLIIGGLDRGVDQSELIDFIQKRKLLKVYCIGQTGKKIHDGLKVKNYRYSTFHDSMGEAINQACCANDLKSVLFSPGAPSYDQFLNFKERTKKFYETLNERR